MTPTRPTPDAVLRARGLVKVHGSGRAERRILDGADLDVAPGELVAIVGRSGSGKSTMLQLLGGLDRPDAGTVEVAGRWVAAPGGGPAERALSALRREAIGFVFQFFHLLPELDGAANVLLPATLPGADARRLTARGRALIEQLGLADVAGAAPAPALRRRAAALRAGPRADRRPAADPRRRADRQPRRRRRRARARPPARGGRRGARGRDGHPPGRGDRARRPRPAPRGRRAGRAARRWRRGPRDGMSGAARFAVRAAGTSLRAQPGRTLLTALGIAAAGLVLGVALTVAFSLSTGFDRAADRADLPTVVARFDARDPAAVRRTVGALPNLAAASYRFERTGLPLRAPRARDAPGRPAGRPGRAAARLRDRRGPRRARDRHRRRRDRARARAGVGPRGRRRRCASGASARCASSGSPSSPTTSRSRWRRPRASRPAARRC